MTGFLRQHAICARLGIHPTTWVRWYQSGAAPQPVNAPGAKKWLEAEIEKFARGEWTSRPQPRRLLSSHR